MGKKIASGTDKAAMRKSGRKNTQPERRVTCRSCNGAGRVDGAVMDPTQRKYVNSRVVCRTCNGAGQVTA